MNRLVLPVIASVLLTGAAYAQGQRGGRNGAPMNGPANALNMAGVLTINGAISSVDIGIGTRYPSITVDRKVIKVAPVWYLLENDFELKAGDQVTVAAAPSSNTADSYLYAIEIVKGSQKIALRNSSGVPLWSGMNGGRGGNEGAPRSGGSIDPSSIATVKGTVASISAGAGIQTPTLVVKAGDGTLVSLRIGPERILLEADFELNPGEAVDARYAVSTCSGENVALQLTNATGVTITLRNDDGSIHW